MIPENWIHDASTRIGPYIHRTALTHDPTNNLYLKWENQQVTGSFKARGAFNKVLTLEPWERQAGLLAASAGNHGQGVAIAGRHFGAPVIIYASQQAVPSKIMAMRSLGAEVRLVPGGYGDAEAAALEAAANSDATWISPYNDGQIIAGQGTLAAEICSQCRRFSAFDLSASTWIIPASGGGLLAGMAAALKAMPNPPRVVGVQSHTSPFLHGIFHRGSQAGLVELPTIADGLAGPVEDGSITIPIVKALVDDIVLVSEAETIQAVDYAWVNYGQRIEGSAATALAAALYGHIPSRPAVLVITGGNIQTEIFQHIIEKTGAEQETR